MGMLKLLCGNIVDDEYLKLADAIVLPTNPMMRCGAGVSGAIFRKAGVDALEQYTELKFGISYYNPPGMNEMKVGEIRTTPGFALPCEIIFAQGPKAYEYESFDEALQALLSTYQNILKHAIQMNYQAILMPAIGTGSYGFTHSDTARDVIKLLKDFVSNEEMIVYFIVYEQDTLDKYLVYDT